MNFSYCILLMCIAAFTLIGCNGHFDYWYSISIDYSRKFVYKDKTYAITNYPHENAEAAQKRCKHFGGYLAEIDDLDEYLDLRNFVVTSASPTAKCVLIGGSDAQNEGTWIFPRTGQPVKILDWAQGEPNSSVAWKGDEDCLSLCKEIYGVKINDLTCGYPGRGTTFMCEVPNND